eukprot:Lithocolla_globosa_v1_NODE_3975_length_1539_cov_6.208895.p1 type:complete len:365 gc:universal NODE_3975_length_1539_cov_6.208895:1249-155(-)
MRWGVIPSWTKSLPDFSTTMKTINCRSDSLQEKKGLWVALRNKKRCVVLADGFFEWHRQGEGKHATKQAYFMQNPEKEQMLYMAGVYDVWKNPETEEKIFSYAIVTIDAADNVSFIHDRMPVVLDTPEKVKLWLECENDDHSFEMAKKVLQSYPSLKFTPVSDFVNKIKNDSEKCVKPIDLEKLNKGKISNFFKVLSPKSKNEAIKKEKQDENDDNDDNDDVIDPKEMEDQVLPPSSPTSRKEREEEETTEKEEEEMKKEEEEEEEDITQELQTDQQLPKRKIRQEEEEKEREETEGKGEEEKRQIKRQKVEEENDETNMLGQKIEEQHVQTLTQMGFESSIARETLLKYDGDIQRATNFLLDQ